MIGACKLNNKSMRNVRREDAYQAMAIDLAMLGVISKEECEMLIGGGIPSGILLPNGSRGKIVSEADLPKQPDFIKTESEETGDETQETQETPEVVTPNAGIVGAPDAGNITIDGGTVSPVDTEGKDPDPIPDATETQEPVNDEGRTESDN